jgi:hypothetical protein
MIERDTGRRDVAAGVGSGELDPAPFPLGVEHAAEKRFDGPNFDQGDFAPAEARFFRVEPGPGEIPIALEPASRERPHFGDRLHRRRRCYDLSRTTPGAIILRSRSGPAQYSRFLMS